MIGKFEPVSAADLYQLGDLERHGSAERAQLYARAAAAQRREWACQELAEAARQRRKAHERRKTG